MYGNDESGFIEFNYFLVVFSSIFLFCSLNEETRKKNETMYLHIERLFYRNRDTNGIESNSNNNENNNNNKICTHKKRLSLCDMGLIEPERIQMQ